MCDIEHQSTSHPGLGTFPAPPHCWMSSLHSSLLLPVSPTLRTMISPGHPPLRAGHRYPVLCLSLSGAMALGTEITQVLLLSLVWLTTWSQALPPGATCAQSRLVPCPALALTVASNGIAAYRVCTSWASPWGFSIFSLLSPQAQQGPHPAFRMPVAMTDFLSGRASLKEGSLLRTFFSTLFSFTPAC